MNGTPWAAQELEALKATFPRGKWPDVLAALSGRNMSSIRQQARVLGVRREVNKRVRWTAAEENVLRRLFPTADQQDILDQMPGRAWANIAKHANELNIKRPMPGSRTNDRFIHAIIRKLSAERCRRKITRPQLSQRLGYHINNILGWELGKTQPSFTVVTDWAMALGFELVLRENAATVLNQHASVTPMSKMMAGR